MLRIRDTNGAASEIHEKFRFVEVCDISGKIAVLIFVDDAGAVKMVEAGTPEATRYQNLFRGQKLEFCPVIHIKA